MFTCMLTVIIEVEQGSEVGSVELVELAMDFSAQHDEDKTEGC